MKKILITGATGNMGAEVIRFLFENNSPNRIVAGVRDVEKARGVFSDFPKLELVPFDFEDSSTFDKALSTTDRVFLLRPPHISDVDKYFRPLFESFLKNKVKEVVFLSVQGAESSKVIPHNKIERLIKEYGLNYIFLRPAYFMQNLTTTLKHDIQTEREIILPAGKAKFNWIDVKNIGEAGAILLDHFSEYSNTAFDIMGYENMSFEEVTSKINAIIENPVRYRNVNPFRFYKIKSQQGVKTGMIIVMILLHFLPRFQKEPSISHFYEQLTGKKPTDLATFIKRESEKLEKNQNYILSGAD
jgi:uncharacterized protein YbjT (DUF2867 family)